MLEDDVVELLFGWRVRKEMESLFSTLAPGISLVIIWKVAASSALQFLVFFSFV
jgi:hypothetical protein